MLHTSPEDEYFLDDLGRIFPVDQGRTTRVRGQEQEGPSFDDAMERVVELAMRDAFPDPNDGLGHEDWSDFRAKRYLDIADGFYLATAVDPRVGAWRFRWHDEVFFSMRPDFVFNSLVTDLGVAPINAVESAIRTRLTDYYRELDALKYALAKGEIETAELYPVEFWTDFWRVRGVAVLEPVDESSESLRVTDNPLRPNERNTLLALIAALCEHSEIDIQSRGAVAQIARLTEVCGFAVSDDTVRRTLGKIPEALESRSK